MRIRTLPNALVAFRAALAVPVAALLVRPEGPLWLAAALFALGVASDVADGALARRRGEASAYGALFDPLADKLLVYAVLAPAALVHPPLAPLVAVLLARDLAVTWRRVELLRRGLTLPATPLARLKTALLFAGCELYLVSLAAHSFGGIALAGACIVAGTVGALLSGGQHLLGLRAQRAAR